MHLKGKIGLFFVISLAVVFSLSSAYGASAKKSQKSAEEALKNLPAEERILVLRAKQYNDFLQNIPQSISGIDRMNLEDQLRAAGAKVAAQKENSSGSSHLLSSIFKKSSSKKVTDTHADDILMLNKLSMLRRYFPPVAKNATATSTKQSTLSKELIHNIVAAKSLQELQEINIRIAQSHVKLKDGANPFGKEKGKKFPQIREFKSVKKAVKSDDDAVATSTPAISTEENNVVATSTATTTELITIEATTTPVVEEVVTSSSTETQ